MGLVLEPVGGWLVAAGLALGLLAVAWWTDRLEARRWSGTVRRTRWLSVFRLLAALLVAVALFRPAWQFTSEDATPAQVLLVTDASRSMNTADAGQGQTRREAVLADVEAIVQQFQDHPKLSVMVQRRDFSAGLQVATTADTPPLLSPPLVPPKTPPADDVPPPVPPSPGTTPPAPNVSTGSVPPATGDQTAIGKTLLDLVTEVRRQRTFAVLLFSDGAQRALAPYDADPVVTARQLGAEQVPLYTIGYGATSFVAANRDLALSDLLVDEVLFARKRVPVTVTLRAVGASGQKVLVRLLQENRTGKSVGQPGVLEPMPASSSAQTQREITLSSANVSQPVELSFVPLVSGEQKLAVEVVPLNDEVLVRNNQVSTLVTVRPGGIRVAYFDVIRTEVKSLSMVNGAQNIQLDYHPVRGGKFSKSTRLDPEWFQRGKYDVYLLGDVPAEVFPAPLLQELGQRLAEGAGLAMLGGLKNFGTGGWADTPLADYLPVRFAPGAAEVQLTGRIAMVPTDLGLRRYVMQLSTGDKNRARWQALAPLVGATRLVPKHELVEVWARAADGNPLLMATEVGRSRVAAFAGDTTWQWVLHDQAADHQRFWRQFLLWLARKEASTDQGVWVQVSPRNFIPGAVAVPQFGARRADGTPATEAQFQIDLISPNGKSQPLTPTQVGDEWQAEFAATQEPGDYWVQVSATEAGASLGLPAVARFVVDPRDLELDNPSSDYDLLRQISSITGGQSVAREELPELIERLMKTTFAAVTRVRQITLWDQWWYLLLFVGCLAGEWALRKRSGMA